MSSIPPIHTLSDQSSGISVKGSELLRAAPEPSSSLGTWVSSAGTALASAGVSIADIAVPGINVGSVTDLLNKQIQYQQFMQTVSMASNVARSQHETEMAPIRNMRLG